MPDLFDDTPDYPEDDPYYEYPEEDNNYYDEDNQSGRDSEDEEVYSNDAPARMTIPVLKSRPGRMISFEQEFIAGGNYIAQQMYNEGLCATEGIGRYGQGYDPEYLVIAKSDASVESEFVYGRMHLEDPRVARKFEKALIIARNAVADGEARLDEACGVHIHVDIHGWTMREVSNLFNLWNYLEDPIFRIASAHWGKGHRSECGNTYAPETNKRYTGILDISRNLESARGAINFQNFITARRNCGCYANNFGLWDQCTCESARLGKTTVEFRVFNTTTNLKKVRAYTALCSALVGWAENPKNIVDREVMFPLGWNNGSNPIRSDEEFKSNLIERFEWILTELPLTQGEREDIYYCIKNNSQVKKYVDGYESLNPVVPEEVMA